MKSQDLQARAERRERAQSVVDAFRDAQDEPGDDFVVTLSQEQARFVGQAMGAYLRSPDPDEM